MKSITRIKRNKDDFFGFSSGKPFFVFKMVKKTKECKKTGY